MAVQRLVRPRVEALLRSHPAVALVGPRQCGKTTLARSSPGVYFDLEQDADRLRLDLEWDALAAGRRLVVLDEAQAHPAVFPRLRGAIDGARRRHGRYLLLGSVAPGLMRQVAESLAGRLAICELTPFLATELPRVPLDRLWLCGGFPDGGARAPARYPEWQTHYLDLLTQRDLPNWGLPATPATTARLVRMLMASHGAIWNASEIGRSLGLSYHTVNGYLDYLEGAFLLRRLPAFAGSVRKRLVRSPRVWWRDSGVRHAVLGVRDHAHLLEQPWVGASWEGFVIEQILGALAATGRRAEASYFRTADGWELDLVLDLEGDRWAIEVKLTTNPGPDDLARLTRAADLVGARRRMLVSRTARPARGRDAISTHLAGALKALDRG